MKPGQLSEHFNRSEWACKCGCGFDTVDAELIMVLEKLNSHFDKKYGSKIRIIITGGNRCIHHNEDIQKEYNTGYVPFSSKSMHMKARACDFKVDYFDTITGLWRSIHCDEVADYLELYYQYIYGIGRYRGRTHLDTRSKKARWDNR